VCTEGVHRSPTAASLFKKSKTFEAKFAGISPFSDKELRQEDLDWADYIFAMEPEHRDFILRNYPDLVKDKGDINVLNVNNKFERGDLRLVSLLNDKLASWIK